VPADGRKLILRTGDGTSSLSASAGIELQVSRRFYMRYTFDGSYELRPGDSYNVSTYLLLLVTVTKNVDLGASMGPYSLGLETHIFL
jgi:hypothetical protein